jgi:hypothetical protein
MYVSCAGWHCGCAGSSDLSLGYLPSITLLIDWCGHSVDCDQLSSRRPSGDRAVQWCSGASGRRRACWDFSQWTKRTSVGIVRALSDTRWPQMQLPWSSSTSPLPQRLQLTASIPNKKPILMPIGLCNQWYIGLCNRFLTKSPTHIMICNRIFSASNDSDL